MGRVTSTCSATDTLMKCAVASVCRWARVPHNHNLQSASMSTLPGKDFGRRNASYAATLQAALANPLTVELGVSPFELIRKDLKLLTGSLKSLVQSDHPVLTTVAEYLLSGSESKRVRPAIVLLMSRACAHGAEPNAHQQRLAEITEMYHTASLLHDDIVDQLDSSCSSAHVNFGNKVAVLGGDFLLARASIQLARLPDPEIIEMMSRVLEHIAQGEIMQMRDSWELKSRIEHYKEKSFLKTGSLIANSCKGSALLGQQNQAVAGIAYDYGLNVGVVLQLTEDILQHSGKSAHADLLKGNTTAPLLYALEEQEALRPLMQRCFAYEGDAERAFEMISQSGAIERTRVEAENHSRVALEHLSRLPASAAVDSLVSVTHNMLNREK